MGGTLNLKDDSNGYDEYNGVALLKMQELSLSAIGSYAYVNGKPSLFIYAALNYPLGGPPFFFVTGVSMGFGYNRALKMPSVSKVLEFPVNGAEWENLIEASSFNGWKGFGSYQSGRISLQDHGSRVAFRNIKIRELN